MSRIRIPSARRAALCALALCPVLAPAQGTVPANGASGQVSLSADGRALLFGSEASDLIAGDTNGVRDIFVLDPTTGAIERASTNPAGGQRFSTSIGDPTLSRDGRYVVGDFRVLDRVTRSSELFTIGVNGNSLSAIAGLNAVSDGGRYAVGLSFDPVGPGDTDDAADVFLRDLVAGTTTNVTAANTPGANTAVPSISADGEFVVFETSAALLPADSNGRCDVYRWRRSTATLQLVTLTPAGAASGGVAGFCSVAVDLSADGNRVAFASRATDLVASPVASGESAIYVRDMAAGITRLEGLDATGVQETGSCAQPRISANGRYVAYVCSTSTTVRVVVDTSVAPGAAGRRAALANPPNLFENSGVAVSNDGTLAWSSRDTGPIGGPVLAERTQAFRARPLAGGAPALASASRVAAVGAGRTIEVALSTSGTVIAFASESADLVPGDVNDVSDVFVRDLASGAIVLASRTPGGTPGNGASRGIGISGDGRYVAFASVASNLVPGDTNGAVDLFRFDRVTGNVVRVAEGVELPSTEFSPYVRPALSADGRYVAWIAVPGPPLNGSEREVFLRDMVAGTVVRATAPAGGSLANGGTFGIDLSDDGRFLAFDSRAGNLVAGDGNNDIDVFVFDRQSGSRTRLSVTATGVEGNGSSFFPRISGDGRRIVFQSNAGNLTGQPGAFGLVRKDRVTGTVDAYLLGQSGVLDLDASGSQALVFALLPPLPSDRALSSESDAFRELYRLDLDDRSAVRATFSSARTRPNGRAQLVSGGLSADGRRAAFVSSSDNYLPDDLNLADDAFVVDLETQTLTLASRVLATSDRDAIAPALSADGRTLLVVLQDRAAAFRAAAGGGPGAAKGGADKWSSIALMGPSGMVDVDVAGNGTPANGNSTEPDIAPAGSVASFTSEATNLGTAPDTNGASDVFVRDLAGNSTTVASQGMAGQPANGPCGDSSIGEQAGAKWTVAMSCTASNLAPGDSNAASDIYLAIEPDVPGQPPQIVLASAAPGGAAGNAPSVDPVVSPDGMMVAFSTLATNLATGGGTDFDSQWDVYLREPDGDTLRISTAAGGGAPDGPSGEPDLVTQTGAGDPWIVAFESRANNLVPGDGNPDADIFVRRAGGATQLVSIGVGGVPANGPSWSPALSPDGRYVSFVSAASNLVAGDGNGTPDVFLRDLVAGTTSRVGAALNQFPQQPALALVGGQPTLAFDTAASNLGATAGADGAFDVVLQTGSGAPVLVDFSQFVFANGFE